MKWTLVAAVGSLIFCYFCNFSNLMWQLVGYRVGTEQALQSVVKNTGIVLEWCWTWKCFTTAVTSCMESFAFINKFAVDSLNLLLGLLNHSVCTINLKIISNHAGITGLRENWANILEKYIKPQVMYRIMRVFILDVNPEWLG